MIDTFNLVKTYSDRIKNDRTVNDVYMHAGREMLELNDELDRVMNKENSGEDGVIGEAIDVISCMLDLIVKTDPNFTSKDFNDYLDKKCQKWETKYHKGDTQ